jgi:hypothetical protein
MLYKVETMAVLGKTVSSSVDYMDLVSAGVVKYFSEKALAGVIGNGTIQSGGIKLASGFMARKFLGRGMIADAVSLGLAIDGVEDILFSVMGGMNTGNSEGGW